MPSPSAASFNPSDPSNFSTPLSPPVTSPPSLSSPSSPTTLPSITHSLLQTTFSLKRDFRFLKLTASSSSFSSSSCSLEIALDESETHKLLQTSLTRLNSATKSFIRDANVLLDEEVNKSFEHAYLRRSSDLKEEEREEGEEEEEGHNVLDMTVEEKKTRKELRRLLGVVEELRGVWRRRAGRYLLGYRGSGGRHGGGKDREEEGKNDREVNGEVHGGKVEDLVVVGRFMIGDDGDRKGEGDGEGDEGKRGKEREDEEIKVGLERLAERLGIGKREEGRVHRL